MTTKCVTCVEQGLRSRLFVGGTSSTLMGVDYYYDEEGEMHNHDPNWRSTRYSCSLGHKFTVSRKLRCPAGDYGDEQEVHRD